MFAANLVSTITNFILGIVELLLGLRILLKLLGANPNTPFVQWIYETSAPLLAPFEGIFPSPQLEGGFILEMSALFALIVYALIGYLIAEALAYGENLAERRTTKKKK